MVGAVFASQRFRTCLLYTSDAADEGLGVDLGGQVRGGLYGDAPDLSNLVDGDPEYTADYRGLYQEVLSSWFDVVPGTNTLRDYSDKRLSKLFV